MTRPSFSYGRFSQIPKHRVRRSLTERRKIPGRRDRCEILECRAFALVKSFRFRSVVGCNDFLVGLLSGARKIKKQLVNKQLVKITSNKRQSLGVNGRADKRLSADF